MKINVQALAVPFLALFFHNTAIADESRQLHATGYAPDTAAFRSSLVETPRFRAFLPESVDNSGFLPPVGNQGTQGSCTTWAVGYYMRSYYEGLRLGKPISQARNAFSPAYIYNQTRHPRGSCGGGTSFEGALKIVRDRGIPSLAAFPYTEHNCSALPDEAVIEQASPYRIRDFLAVRGSIDNIKGALAQGHIVAASIHTTDSFHRFRGNGNFQDLAPLTESEKNSGHAMVIVGYDDRRQAFRFVNSWDTDWGDKGYVWIEYDTYRYLRDEDTVYLMDIDSSALPPSPPPQPAPKPTPSPVPSPAPAPVPPPVVVKPDIKQLQVQIGSLLRGLACAKAEALVDADGRVQLKGMLGKQNELDDLKTSIAALKGVKSVSSSIRISPWPQCEVYLNFEEQLKDPKGLSARFGEGKEVLREGESLAVEVQTPNYPSYLYVSYLQASGEVVHLSWPQGRFPKAIAPNTRLTFGGGQNGQPIYRIGKPFGDEMVVIVASASPLFPEEILKVMDDREYLSSFRRAFVLSPKDGGGRRNVATIALPLKTFAKN